jgi:hypothetical protein
MSRWQHIEAGMFLVAHAIMGTEFKYTSTMFFLINSADLKLRLVNGLCKLYLNEDQFKSNWQPIAKDIKSAIKFRNGVAHFEPNFVADRSYLEADEPPCQSAPRYLGVPSRPPISPEKPCDVAVKTLAAGLLLLGAASRGPPA